MQTPTTRRLNGASLRVIREAYGVSLSDLALRAQVSRPFVSLMESGARQPSAATLRQLADALGVPIEAISYPNLAAPAA
ncbi:helix-turn-helix domain-containing protein [Cellulomonas sp. ACRRI]|uniref:helix-turn-helix domain-containing protein n=1 Tax=Cellulomonas sp. ACRRI TaxID=2918188 RepID=UPI001EF2B05C|nr:helix-turn-helix transcriptional regulator [Cellulomonas sp. ACRRI]MCG7284989.1 helix-turn-helix domain-containing protein [Cellulomonas sp. ACRRI]